MRNNLERVSRDCSAEKSRSQFGDTPDNRGVGLEDMEGFFAAHTKKRCLRWWACNDAPSLPRALLQATWGDGLKLTDQE